MKIVKDKFVYFFIFAVLLIFYSQAAISQEKSSKTDTRLLMHNPNGLRIKQNITTSNLEIWISPKANESLKHFDRNFSNRDDHTLVFDQINFPKLKGKSYISCEYDPFYSKIIYKNQVMHIATLYDYPAVIIWFDKPEAVDFKTDKQDEIKERTRTTFISSHPDRGYNFTFAAGAGEGRGEFIHQLQLQKGRSSYARLDLTEKQLLVITAEVENKNVEKILEKLLSKSAKELIEETEQKVKEKTKFGRVLVNDNPQLQKLMDMNKRIWVSMQDKAGAIRASLKAIYYLIWVRDGGMAASYTSQTGWIEPVDLWTNYLLNNPTIIKDEEPAGEFFGQLVGGPINKWEEDGLFYATLSAFTHWTQSGSRKYISEKYLQTLKNANQWLEEYCFDENTGLFGRYHYCETPLVDSRGHNWDNAVGKYMDKWQPQKYKGNDIVRSYDIYINMLAYSTYLMFAAMETPENAKEYIKKADRLEKNMKQFFPEEGMPHYGNLVTKQGDTILAKGYGLDPTDYQWALSLTPFVPQYFDAKKIGKSLIDSLRFDEDWFLAAYFCIHSSLDNAFFNEHTLMQTMNCLTKKSAKAGKILPMEYAMLEKSGVPVDHFRVIRPQPFTMGPWFSSLTNMSLRRLPFGLAVRNTVYINGIDNYQYKNALLNYAYQGEGEISSLKLNGKQIMHSWQIPEKLLNKGNNELIVLRGKTTNKNTLLISSTILLHSVNTTDNKIVYTIQGYGKNFMAFKNIPAGITILDENGKSVSFTNDKQLGVDRIYFEGRGEFSIELSR